MQRCAATSPAYYTLNVASLTGYRISKYLTFFETLQETKIIESKASALARLVKPHKRTLYVWNMSSFKDLKHVKEEDAAALLICQSGMKTGSYLCCLNFGTLLYFTSKVIEYNQSLSVILGKHLLGA
jgi:hypothetical protein